MNGRRGRERATFSLVSRARFTPRLVSRRGTRPWNSRRIPRSISSSRMARDLARPRPISRRARTFSRRDRERIQTGKSSHDGRFCPIARTDLNFQINFERAKTGGPRALAADEIFLRARVSRIKLPAPTYRDGWRRPSSIVSLFSSCVRRVLPPSLPPSPSSLSRARAPFLGNYSAKENIYLYPSQPCSYFL